MTTTGELVLIGQLVAASNATFVGELDGRRVVYKPVAGERPLWDFPDGCLAHRELAAYAVSEALGWELVPPTWLGEGPHGTGMLQEWREPDPGQRPVDVVPLGEIPDGYRHVLDAVDADERPVSLVHEDSALMRRMALFDVLVNNADRKGGHVLAMPGGHRYGVDHGVTFHTDGKLRTVLWGWLGEPLSDDERSSVKALLDDQPLARALDGLLAPAEVDAFRARGAHLLADGVFPAPSGGWPAIPWPAF
jgi:uncharacterized repeat protein (TIGR03843 family)